MAPESMGFGRHKRQLLLFLAAILVPAAVLVGLAVRVIRQEAELAQREDGDQRRLALDQVRRELAARLEAIKAQELNRRIRAQSALTAEQTDPAIVFVTSRAGDRLTPPWGSGTARTVATPQF